MRAILIQPPIRDFYRTRFREYPLGLLYLAGSMRSNGWDVKILDARSCKRPKRVALPPHLSYLGEIYTRGNDAFLHYQHFGLGYDEILDAVSEYSPDLIGISCMFTPYIEEAIETARAARLGSPAAKIIAGGHHATVDRESLAESGAFDEIVRGEGEVWAQNRCQAESCGEIFRTPSLDALPMPARDLVDPSQYMLGDRRYAMIVTSRGCPHACSFCSIHAVAGFDHRVRSIDSIVEEIDQCVDRYGIKAIDLQDDNLLFNSDRIKRLLEIIIDRYSGRDVELLASNGLNVAHIDGELVGLMKRAGFRKLDIALGTGGVSSRAMLLRPENIDKYEDVLSQADASDLSTTTYIVLGFPFQPISEMRETVEYLKGKGTFIAPSIFYNVPGMPIFEEMKKYEYVDDHRLRRSTALNCFGKDFSRDDIFNLFLEIRKYNLGLRG